MERIVFAGKTFALYEFAEESESERHIACQQAKENFGLLFEKLISSQFNFVTHSKYHYLKVGSILYEIYLKQKRNGHRIWHTGESLRPSKRTTSYLIDLG